MNKFVNTPELKKPHPQTQPPPTDWFSLAQFGCSSAVFSFFIILSFGMIVFSIFRWGTPEVMGRLILASGLGLISFLALLSVLFSSAKVFNKPVVFPDRWPNFRKNIHPTRSFWLIPLLLALGFWAEQGGTTRQLWILPFHVLTVGWIALCLAWLGIRGLPKGSNQRIWGMVLSGLVLAPFIIGIIELLALVLGILLVVVNMFNGSALAGKLYTLGYYFQNFEPGSEITTGMLEALNQPEFLTGALIFIAGVVPLIEEALKPVGILLLGGRDIDPKKGFVYGLISGAAFGITETVFAITSIEMWSASIILRFGGSVIHAALSGLMGWALVMAWKERRFLRLGAAYLLAAVYHGLWNGAAILVSFASFQVKSPIVPSYIMGTAPIFFVALIILGLAFIYMSNKFLNGLTGNEPDGLNIESGETL